MVAGIQAERHGAADRGDLGCALVAEVAAVDVAPEIRVVGEVARCDAHRGVARQLIGALHLAVDDDGAVIGGQLQRVDRVDHVVHRGIAVGVDEELQPGGAGSLRGGEEGRIGLDALRAPILLPIGAAVQIGRAHIGSAALRAAILGNLDAL